MQQIPVVGPIFFAQPITTYIALVLPFIVAFVLYKTNWGLNVRAVGDNPQAAGTAGTPGAGMIMLAMVLTAIGIPTDMIMIIFGVDRLFDMGRTCLNVTGDICTACCVTKWEKKK